jgi:hypothetical protein
MTYPSVQQLSLQPGLYKARERRSDKGVLHYGILDVGNRMRIPLANGFNVVVIHQLPPRIKCEYTNPAGWQDLENIEDESGAIERLRSALARPEYNVFGNNCEHFVNYVAYGIRRSLQVELAGIGGGLVAIGLVIANWGDAA